MLMEQDFSDVEDSWPVELHIFLYFLLFYETIIWKLHFIFSWVFFDVKMCSMIWNIQEWRKQKQKKSVMEKALFPPLWFITVGIYTK